MALHLDVDLSNPEYKSKNDAHMYGKLSQVLNNYFNNFLFIESEKSLDKKETFYICQTKVIIQNPLAFNCCEFMTNPDKCSYFPSTQLMIVQTTEISNTNTIIRLLFCVVKYMLYVLGVKNAGFVTSPGVLSYPL